MIVTTQDNSILNLDNFDALEMKYQGYYNRSEYTISAIIFDAVGGVAVENRVCQFRSENEAISYLEEIETNTAYVTIAKRRERERTLLNLARFHSLELVVKDVPPSRVAGKMMSIETVPSTKKQATVKAIQYDAFGSVLKTVAYREKFISKDQAVEWFEELTQRRAT